MKNMFEELKVDDQEEDSSDSPLALVNHDSSDLRLSQKPGPEEHPLQFNHSMWLSTKQYKSTTNYEKNLTFLSSFSSVEQFWAVYSHLLRPSELKTGKNYYLFKGRITPMWEDEANEKGGAWCLRVKKGLISRYWEYLILALIGEQFIVGDEICGAGVSVRFPDDFLSLWNRNAEDQAVKTRICDTLKRILHLPASTHLEYRSHFLSLSNAGKRSCILDASVSAELEE